MSGMVCSRTSLTWLWVSAKWDWECDCMGDTQRWHSLWACCLWVWQHGGHTTMALIMSLLSESVTAWGTHNDDTHHELVVWECDCMGDTQWWHSSWACCLTVWLHGGHTTTTLIMSLLSDSVTAWGTHNDDTHYELADTNVDWKNLSVNKCRLTLFMHKSGCCSG